MAIKFENPPLTELVLGIQFPTNLLTSNDIFNFYKILEEEFPVIQEHPLLPAFVEDGDESTLITFQQLSGTRKFFISESGEHLIQLQPNRIIFNWRKSANGNENQYQNYLSVLDNFFNVLKKLDSNQPFFEEVNQYEITCFDQFVLSDLNLELEECYSAFNLFSINYPIKSLDCTFQLKSPELGGVTYVALRSAKRNEDQQDLIILETTCRGFQGSGIENIHDWLTKAHDHLVNTFVNLISDKTMMF